ncbi:class I SAM-dependent methyltransferase [Streptomyces africanus]|nr:class I SAM-dependent methyltransferase [Streptomyces africanus]
MALSTGEIRALVAEVRRVLRPGGAFLHTVRHTGDAYYRDGTGHGDDIWGTAPQPPAATAVAGHPDRAGPRSSPVKPR